MEHEVKLVNRFMQEIRATAGLSRAEVCRQLYVKYGIRFTQETLGRWEKKAQPRMLRALAALCEIYQIKMGSLFETKTLKEEEFFEPF